MNFFCSFKGAFRLNGLKTTHSVISRANEAWFSLALCLVAGLCCVREGANPDPVSEMFKTTFSCVGSFVSNESGLTLQPVFNSRAHRVFLCYSDAASLKLVVI